MHLQRASLANVQFPFARTGVKYPLSLSSQYSPRRERRYKPPPPLGTGFENIVKNCIRAFSRNSDIFLSLPLLLSRSLFSVPILCFRTATPTRSGAFSFGGGEGRRVDGLTRQKGQSSHRRKRMVSACVQEIKLVNLASDPVEFPVKIFYRRRVAFLEFVGQKPGT